MTSKEIREKAVEVATKNVYGEQGANNDGAFIRAMGGVPGEEWCGLYAGYCHRRAHQLLGLKPPRWAWRKYPTRLEVGAKALVKAMSRAREHVEHVPGEGVLITDPKDFLPGDLIAFHRRTGPISWKGHVALCTGNDASGIHTLEGNVGEFPAMVQRFRYTVDGAGWLRHGRYTARVRFAFGAGLR